MENESNKSDLSLRTIVFAIGFVGVICATIVVIVVVYLSLVGIMPGWLATFISIVATILPVSLAVLAYLSAKKSFPTAMRLVIAPVVWLLKRVVSLFSRENRKVSMIMGVIIAIILIGVGGYHYIRPSQPSVPPLIFSSETPNGLIGISDGSYAFDVVTRNNGGYQGHNNGALKQQAADAFRKQNFDQARQLWGQATTGDDSDDAEVLIYQENQRVIESGVPYITFIAVTQLTGSHEEAGIGREDLQGYYVAQKQFNKQGNPFQVRLLIANVGDQETYAQQVTGRILSSSRQDPTIKGVLGWPERTSRINSMILNLCRQNIPIVTVSANDIVRSDDCPFTFSVAPSIDLQVDTAAQYIEYVLKKKRVAIVYDPANDYSQQLYGHFMEVFPKGQASGAAVIDQEAYSVYNNVALPGLMRAILRGKPDLIYFAGYPGDLNMVLQSLPASGGVDVMAANIIYQAPQFPKAQPVEHIHVYFTAFAYPDQWGILHQAQPDFPQVYATTYDPERSHPGSYGYGRANDSVMIAYDAANSLLVASQGFSSNNFSTKDLQQALSRSRYKGITGDIVYNHGSVDTKPVVVIEFTHGYNQFRGVEGCYDDSAQGGCFDIQTNGRP